jgi:hypothetical protein
MPHLAELRAPVSVAEGQARSFGIAGGSANDEELLDLWWLIEQMVDIEEDLLQYHEDIQRNVYIAA